MGQTRVMSVVPPRYSAARVDQQQAVAGDHGMAFGRGAVVWHGAIGVETGNGVERQALKPGRRARSAVSMSSTVNSVRRSPRAKAASNQA